MWYLASRKFSLSCDHPYSNQHCLIDAYEQMKQESLVQWNFKSVTRQAGKAMKFQWKCRGYGRGKKMKQEGKKCSLALLWLAKCYSHVIPGTVPHHECRKSHFLCVAWGPTNAGVAETVKTSLCWKLSFSSDENKLSSIVMKNQRERSLRNTLVAVLLSFPDARRGTDGTTLLSTWDI